MHSNRDTLLHCALSRFRLLLIRAENEGWRDDNGTYFDESDKDVQKTEKDLTLAVGSNPMDAKTLCLYAQFLDKKRNFHAAEGLLISFIQGPFLKILAFFILYPIFIFFSFFLFIIINFNTTKI
jgi:hypothetical protein